MVDVNHSGCGCIYVSVEVCYGPFQSDLTPHAQRFSPKSPRSFQGPSRAACRLAALPWTSTLLPSASNSPAAEAQHSSGAAPLQYSRLAWPGSRAVMSWHVASNAAVACVWQTPSAGSWRHGMVHGGCVSSRCVLCNCAVQHAALHPYTAGCGLGLVGWPAVRLRPSRQCACAWLLRTTAVR